MKAEWTNKDSLSIESTGQKAILVIDMPKACADGCPVMCRARGINHRPTWCPLRPLPEKMTIKIPDGLSESSKMTIHSILRVGWESCIKEILGETE